MSSNEKSIRAKDDQTRWERRKPLSMFCKGNINLFWVKMCAD